VYTRALENLSLVPATWVIDEMERVERAESKAVIQDNLVQILLFTEAYAQPEPILREAIRDRPTDLDLQANLAVTLAALNRSAEATEIYNRILATPNVPPGQLFNIGVALFGANEPRRAAQAFARVTEIQPNSRDAWFNQANALYEAASNITDAAQAMPLWMELANVSSRHIAIDPLSETAFLIQAAAFRESMRNNEALAALERSEALPVHLEEMTIVPSATSTTVTAKAIGNSAPPGTQVRLRFTFYNDAGEVGTQMATVTAPARDVEIPFEVRIDQAARAYKYEVVP
jgi:tetratricopeptide (TPR) repeat protein